jgi:hypothetical protein
MSRLDFVQQILANAPAVLLTNVDTQSWWWIPPIEDNWRLTWLGYSNLVELNVKSWEFEFGTNEFRPWMYLTLTRNLQAPFYIVGNKKHHRLVIFDSKSAVMINLYGDLIRWIKSIK